MSTATASGRLTTTVGRRTQRLVYGRPTPEEIGRELALTSTVDRAHLVMLTECGLVGPEDAAALLARIERLRAEEFAPLHHAPTPRGLYLAYENHLIAHLGAEVGGRLHTGRSRNDLKATVQAMDLRTTLAGLGGELVRLQAVLLARARAHRDVLMPVHTHYQAALPITYGYYLAGIALALGRDITALDDAARGLDRCPMGAAAAAGSELPIDPARVAGLLGFAGPARHALDAVASRDTALRALAAAAGAALTVSRLGTDLQLWSTTEFGFVTFPDRLVGGSSAMPQKRNAFLLEHVKARAATAIGAWTTAASMTRSTPFTNSIEVGTEAIGATGPGLRAVADTVQLAQSLVLGACPVPERMLRRAQEGFVGATALANLLVGEGVPFRTAHRDVGDAVRRAVERGDTRLTRADLPPELADTELSLTSLAMRQKAGGPGDFDAVFADALADCRAHADRAARRRAALAAAGATLDEAVAARLTRRPAPAAGGARR
ncbi:argininosuccinate lyase [Streptomyces sp. NPDC003717]|uniref:argininosuccinate lyase n=1 Tax=Streptomyces sp. NPDC003717 TaxID=3154276 RepID=UPI0033BF02D4